MLQMTIRRPPACANRLRIASGPTSWCHAPGGCSRAGALFPFRSLYATARTRAIAALASSAAYKGSAGRGFGQQTPGGRRRRAARFPNSAPRAVGFYHGSPSGVRTVMRSGRRGVKGQATRAVPAPAYGWPRVGSMGIRRVVRAYAGASYSERVRGTSRRPGPQKA